MTKALPQSPQEAVEFHQRSMAEFEAVEFESIEQLREAGGELKTEAVDLADRWSLDARGFAAEWDAFIEERVSLFLAKAQLAAEKKAREQSEAAAEEPAVGRMRRPGDPRPKTFKEAVAEIKAVQEAKGIRSAGQAKAASAAPILDRRVDGQPKIDPGPKIDPTAWPEAPVAPVGASELDRLTYPRGLLGHAVQYVEDTSPLPNRWLSLWTALSALAKGIDRKVLGPMGNSVVLWLLMLAETGAGKQHGLSCLRIMLRAMVVENTLVASGLGSVQGIEEILMGTATLDANPNALVAIDEVGAWLKRISSGGQTGNVAEIPAMLQSLWGWPPQLEWVGSKTKGRKMDVVHGPAFSLYGVSTETKFIKALTGEQVSNGFVNRMLLANIGPGALKRIKAKYDWTRFPSWLADALKAIAGPKRAEGPMRLELPVADGSVVVLKDFRQIGWGTGAEEVWQRYEDEIRAMPSVEDRELWIRAPGNALRLATVVAAFAGSAVVEVRDIEWGIGVVDQSMRWLVRALRKNMTEDLDQVDLVERIRNEFIKKIRKGEPKPQLTQGQIRKLCERLTKDHRKIDQAIDHLVKCGDIVELDQLGKVGQPTRKWEWQG